jgi:hypothetical protein
MTFSYDQIHLPPLSNLVFTLSLYMELQVHHLPVSLGWEAKESLLPVQCPVLRNKTPKL